jgi:hypothetical protein
MVSQTAVLAREARYLWAMFSTIVPQTVVNPGRARREFSQAVMTRFPTYFENLVNAKKTKLSSYLVVV